MAELVPQSPWALAEPRMTWGRLGEGYVPLHVEVIGTTLEWFCFLLWSCGNQLTISAD